MPVYLYIARNREGKTVQGQQEAPSEIIAINILQNNNLYVTQIVNTASQIKGQRRIAMKRHRRIKSEDMLFFIAQTANLLAVGIPVTRALEVVSDQTESAELYKVIMEIIANVRAGSTLKDAMARHPKVFPAFWSYLIEAGEVSGTLPQVMTQLAKNMEASEHLKKKVVSVLVYPSVLISASVAAIVFFMLFIVPIFSKMFKSFNAPLPGITLAIIAASDILRHYFLILIGVIIGIVQLLKRHVRAPQGKRQVHIMLLATPVLGGAISDIIHARISNILAMLIRSGLSFLRSLEITANVSGNYLFETALQNVKLDVQQGKTLSVSLGENSLFSPMFVNLVKIGEESGKLPEMIEKAAEYFQGRVDVFAARVGVLIEPIVMIVVGGAIGLVAVSLFLPIVRISQVVK